MAEHVSQGEDRAVCLCGHTAYWHNAIGAPMGAGECEHDGECRCTKFRTGEGFQDFDWFFENGGYVDGEEPQAFADWLAGKTGRRVSGVATDLSGAVQADPPTRET